MSDARKLCGAELAAALRDSRQRTLSMVDDLSPTQWNTPLQLGVNPGAWELAHIAWFAEFWILRDPHHCDAQGLVHAAHPPRFAGPDALLDSARLAHAQRWTETLPTRAELVPMPADQLEGCIAALPVGAAGSTDAAQDPLYFHRLALFHEDMHAEAFCWMRSALEYPAPCELTVPRLPVSQPIACGPGGVCQAPANGNTRPAPNPAFTGATAYGSGHRTPLRLIPASHPALTMPTRSLGLATTANCAAAHSPATPACTTCATAIFFNRTARMCLQASGRWRCEVKIAPCAAHN